MSSLSLQDLRSFKEQGGSYSTLLVRQFLLENGPTPVGIIADVCGISLSSAERALAFLRKKGFVVPQPSKIQHDHANQIMEKEGTVARNEAIPVRTEESEPDDPLREALLSYEVLPWCVDILLERVERQVIERQLKFHAYRLKKGFRFKSHPAKYLFKACLGDYLPPEGIHKPQEAALEGSKIQTPTPMLERPKDEPLDDAQKLETVAKMIHSPIAASQRLGKRLAHEWGIVLDSITERPKMAV